MEIIKEEDIKKEAKTIAKQIKTYSLKSSFGLLFLRVIFGICVLTHGISKIQNFTSSMQFIQELLIKNNLPQIMSYGVFVGEVIAPFLIIIGLFTRISSIIVFLNCLTILYLAHLSNLFGMTPQGGFINEIVFLYIGCSLCLIFTGSGKFALRKS